MTHNDEETSFSDAYRSEILNKGQEKEKSPFPKIISILLLSIGVSAISIFGYNHLTSDEKKVEISQHENIKKVQETQENTLPEPVDSMIDNVEDLESMESSQVEATPIPTPIATPTSNHNDIDQIANQMKLELSKELDKKSVSSSKKIETASETEQAQKKQKGEEIYMQQLRELSEEINREAI